jgi:hypothetical protein
MSTWTVNKNQGKKNKYNYIFGTRHSSVNNTFAHNLNISKISIHRFFFILQVTKVPTFLPVYGPQQ